MVFLKPTPLPWPTEDHKVGIQRFYTNSYGSFKYCALTAKPETASMSPPSLNVMNDGKDLAKVSISNGGAKNRETDGFSAKV